VAARIGSSDKIKQSSPQIRSRSSAFFVAASLVPAFVCQQMSHRTQSDLFIEGHNTNEQNQGYGDQSFEPFRLP